MNTSFCQDDRGRPLLDLRARAGARRPDLGDLPELTDAERQMAVRTWLGRMVNEHLSAQVWASLVPQGMRAALPPDVLSSVAEAVGDELRHAEMCAGVVLALGGDPIAVLPAVESMPEHADVGPLEAVLRNVVSVGCLSETVAVAVIRAEQAELDGTALGEVLTAILGDEIQHARLGWRVLGQVVPLLDDPARARLSAYLVDALAHQVAYEVPRLPVNLGLREAVNRAGVCDGSFARRVFLETIETVIVPGLAAAGLDARAAWTRARAETQHLLAS